MTRFLPLWAACLILGLAPAGATEECLVCHDAPETLADSVHGIFDCTDCHADLAGLDMHEDTPAPVECAMCHDAGLGRHGLSDESPATCADCHGDHAILPLAEQAPDCSACHTREARLHARSLHGKAAERGDELAPGCADCHGGHEILPADDPQSLTAVMNVPVLCGRCHQEGSPVTLNRNIHQDHVLENYSMSIHGVGLYQQGLTVTAVCTSCHTAHDILPHTDERSSIHHDNVAQTCASCHGQIEQVHQKVIEGRLWETEPHKIPSCVDCHAPHKIRNVRYPAGSANEDCLSCHADASLTATRDGQTVSLFVDPATHEMSAHADTACAQCHTGVTPSLERSCETIVDPVDCSICHAEPVNEYNTGIHGTLVAAGDPDAPTCRDCHGQHDIQLKEIPSSPTFKRNVPELCAECHREGERAARRIDSEVPDIFGSYLDSIHGKGLVESGLLVTATCADCHTPHGELPIDDERSTVHHDNIAGMCGNCHHGIEETFKGSVHSPKEGEVDAEHRLPSCEDCHSSHTIGRTDKAGFRFEMQDQCGRCHETEAETFFDTFHGKVSRLGSEGAAKCYDCHGTHNILPTTDPDSMLGRNNVVETCGQCHAGSNEGFTLYQTHATHNDRDKYPWLFWSFWGMTALLIGTLSFALLHTLAWLVRLWLSRDEWKKHKEMAEARKGKLYRRFDRFSRTLHIVMMISFFTLALTGMALKFSYMRWAQLLSTLLGGFDSMAFLHRFCAVILFGIFVAHLWDVRRKKRREGKGWRWVLTGPDTILFTKRDLKDVLGSIRWFFGLGPRPSYGRYTYWEKFDYFAVLWGIVIIGSTGLILWFPEFFTNVIPGWFVNVATIIHSDEALLAVGFIFTIHFFNTHFRPDKFPMDPVIFTGRITLEELKYDKPDEYKQMVESGRLEERMVKPFPRQAEKAIRVFAFTALTIGLTLIVLIIYSMLFG